MDGQKEGLARHKYATGFINWDDFSEEYKANAIRVPLTEHERGFIENYRGQKEYIFWRDTVRCRDNYTCQRCGSTEKVIAHHILTFAEYPYLRFNPENGITLCPECHKIVHRELREEEKKRIYHLIFEEHYVLSGYRGRGYRRSLYYAEVYKEEPTKEEIFTFMQRYGVDSTTVQKEYGRAEIPFFGKLEEV